MIIAGGEQITACPEYSMLDCPGLDIAVCGEGEETLVELLEKLSKKEDLSSVNGIYFRGEGGQIIHTHARKRILDIDSIPEPAWELFPLANYIENSFTHGANLGRSAPLLASRGCPFQCTFCSNPVMWSPLWKARSPEQVVSEMKTYITKYQVSNFDFMISPQS